MKGNEKIIEHLNARLADELTAINQYFVHARCVKTGITSNWKKWSRSEPSPRWGTRRNWLHASFPWKEANRQQAEPNIIGAEVPNITWVWPWSRRNSYSRLQRSIHLAAKCEIITPKCFSNQSWRKKRPHRLDRKPNSIRSTDGVELSGGADYWGMPVENFDKPPISTNC